MLALLTAAVHGLANSDDPLIGVEGWREGRVSSPRPIP